MFKLFNDVFKLILIIFLLFLSCKTLPRDTFPNPKNSQYRIPDSINTTLNREFIKSRKSFAGSIKDENITILYIALERYLKTKLHRGKSVLINYKQRGNNCFNYSYHDLVIVTGNIKRISNRISKNYAIQDFFIFSKSAYNRDVFEETGYYIEDSGFFKKNIFTIEETCDAFFLFKPNGEFLKFYGGDYFSEIKNFMEGELVYGGD